MNTENEVAQPPVTANEGVIWVGSTTETQKLASSIFNSRVKEGRGEVKLRGIGAGAVNQMTKAYIIAKGKLIEKGIAASIDVSFKDVEPEDTEEKKTITAIEFTVTFK